MVQKVGEREKVRPPQEPERTKEKPVPDKVQDELLSSAADAGTSVANTIENATQTVKKKVPFGKQQLNKDASEEEATPKQSDLEKKEEDEAEKTLLGRLREKLATSDGNKDDDGVFRRRADR